MKYSRILFLLLLFNMPLLAQFGYTFDDHSITLPDTTIRLDAYSLPVPSEKEDVKAVGMGKTQIANGKDFNAMLYNPALLSRKRFSIDALSVNVSLPPKTYDAANYLVDHLDEFKDALSLKEVWAGIDDFNNAAKTDDINQELIALKRIQEGMKFPKEILDKVVGSTDDPITHGIRIIPAFSMQINNFGFTLYSVAQSAFEVEQSPVIDALLAVELPEDLNDPQQVATAILSMEGILQPIQELNSFDDALPVAYSLSYVDLVGAFGYSYDVTPNLSIGANLKVIHRRFSAKRILFKEYENILNILKRDLNQYITGVTLDIGGLYKFPIGTEVGLSIQNIIPVQKITSTLKANFAYTYFDYKTNAQGQKVVNNQGDTVLQSVNQTVKVEWPFDLKLPMIINVGATHPITQNWDVSLDWVDISDQDIKFTDYTERFRIGTEYRLDAIKQKLGVAFRLGMADEKLTGGIGFNIYKALQIDGAYAYDNYVESYSYYAQIKLGW
jgi:hypothetical protein